VSLAITFSLEPGILRDFIDSFSVQIGEPRLDVAGGNHESYVIAVSPRWNTLGSASFGQLIQPRVDTLIIAIDYDDKSLGDSMPIGPVGR